MADDWTLSGFFSVGSQIEPKSCLLNSLFVILDQLVSLTSWYLDYPVELLLMIVYTSLTGLPYLLLGNWDIL